MDKRKYYLSNLDKKIYIVYNLPEEIIATLFAYVSRSSNSLREDILKITEEKAKGFHEKWVINYGHASIAEMAVIHIGIEKVSRLFSMILERSNPHISFIEYSQRYQKVNKNDFFISNSLDFYPNLKKLYNSIQIELYGFYQKVIEILLEYYQKRNKENLSIQSLYRKSFEDARGILSLAFHTNLSMTVNARALEESLIYLLSSPYEEVRNIALEIKKEALLIFPTLIKYVKEDSFLISLQQKKKVFFSKKKIKKNISVKNTSIKVKYILLNGSIKMNSEDLLDNILLKYYYSSSVKTLEDLSVEIKMKTMSEKRNIFQDIFQEYSKYSLKPDFLEEYTFRFEVMISEACWHQFLRHRKIRIIDQFPTMDNGYLFPHHLDSLSEISMIFDKAFNKAKYLFECLYEVNEYLPHYAVLNMSFRRFVCEFDLSTLYHLIHLRLSPNAQTEIQDLIWKFVHILYPQYNIVLDPALKVLQNSYPNDPKILENINFLKNNKN